MCPNFNPDGNEQIDPKHRTHQLGPTDGVGIRTNAAGLDLKNIFCFESIRTVNYDYTITLEAQFIQILPSPAPMPPPRQKVTVRRWLDGSLHIFWHDHELLFKQLKAKPAPRPRTYFPAPHSHPWRDKIAGTKERRFRHYRRNL